MWPFDNHVIIMNRYFCYSVKYTQFCVCVLNCLLPLFLSNNCHFITASLLASSIPSFLFNLLLITYIELGNQKTQLLWPRLSKNKQSLSGNI